jgi:hypothetical protein
MTPESITAAILAIALRECDLRGVVDAATRIACLEGWLREHEHRPDIAALRRERDIAWLNDALAETLGADTDYCSVLEMGPDGQLTQRWLPRRG